MPTGPNPILSAANATFSVTNYTLSGSAAIQAISGIPMGTADGTATGELAVKVLLVGAASGGGGLAVQGLAANNAVSAGNPVYIGGLAVAYPYAPAFTAGDAAAIPVDTVNGGVLCDVRKLTFTDDAVATQAIQKSTVSTFTPITADGTVFTLAAGEKGYLQNLDDAAVYVKLGATASSSSFNFVLKSGTAANDGLGGIAVIDDYVGVVSIAAATGSPRLTAYKLS